MECMKCGQKVAAGESFCDSCLADMKRYPVKPDTVIKLPQRLEGSQRPVARRRSLTEEERIERLTMSNRILRCALMLTVLIILLLSYSTHMLLNELEESQNIGKNYTSIENSDQQEASDPDGP